MNKKPTKTIAITGMFIALEIALLLLTELIPTQVNINLSLIPIAIGAIFYGPFVGMTLGFASGVMTIFLRSTLAFFMPISAIGTIFTCITKTTVAGLVAGLISKGLKEKPTILRAVLSSLVIPFINTGIFLICYITIFDANHNMDLILETFIGLNFFVEAVSMIIICPAISKSVQVAHFSREAV